MGQTCLGHTFRKVCSNIENRNDSQGCLHSGGHFYQAVSPLFLLSTGLGFRKIVSIWELLSLWVGTSLHFYRWFKWLVHLNVVYTVGIFISFPCIAIFFCTPVSNYWTLGSPPDTCMDEAVATLICGIINCVADLLTTLTPIPLVLKVRCIDPFAI